jgi:hypothetical protein
MILCPELKLVFIHIPKTGGSSVSAILTTFTNPLFRESTPFIGGQGWQKGWHLNSDQHASFLDGRPDLHGATDETWRYLATCRNPYDRAASIFASYYAEDFNVPDSENALFGEFSPDRRVGDFFSFVRSRKAAGHDYFGFRTQTAHVAGVPQDRFRVIRFESYEADTRRVLSEFGIDFDSLPHFVNGGEKRQRVKAQVMQHPDFRGFVNEVYAEDFAFFGYDRRAD